MKTVGERDLFEVRWRQREDGAVEQCTRLVLASSKANAIEAIYDIEGAQPLKRYPPRAVQIDSEDALRALCPCWRPEHTFVEDERDYLCLSGIALFQANGDCWGRFLSDILPDLRERWKQRANDAEEKRLQLAFRFPRKKENSPC